MSKALKTLRGRERSTIDNLVHCFVMADVSKNVKGMEGLFDHYIKHDATPDTRRLWKAFQARVAEVRKDMAEMMEKDKT